MSLCNQGRQTAAQTELEQDVRDINCVLILAHANEDCNMALRI